MKKELTKEEWKAIASNPYTAKITNEKIIYTLEFKQFVIRKTEEGYSSIDIFRAAGYDVDVLGKQYIYDRIKGIRQEASSPSGLKPPRGIKSAEKFAAENLKKHHVETSVKILQDRIAYLEQEVEFLKKTELLELELTEKKAKPSSD